LRMQTFVKFERSSRPRGHHRHHPGGLL